MILLRTTFLSLLLPALIAGCISVYIPSPAVTPLFTGKGELAAAASYSSAGTAAQIAYSPVNHLALMASGSLRPAEAENGSNHRYGDVAIGGYLMTSGSLRVEAMAGIGAGSALAYGTELDFFGGGSNVSVVEAQGEYVRLFAQTNVGISLETDPIFSSENGLFEGGVALRFAQVRFDRYRVDGELQDLPEDLFVEPILFARIGTRQLQLETQFGLSRSLGDGSAFDYHPYLFSAGVHLRL